MISGAALDSPSKRTARTGYLYSINTLGAAVGIGFAGIDEPLTQESVSTGDWEIDVAGERIRARASLKTMFDPRMERIKC